MIKLTDDIKKSLIELSETKGVFLEGNIIKLMDPDGDEEFTEYLKKCSERIPLTEEKDLRLQNKSKPKTKN